MRESPGNSAGVLLMPIKARRKPVERFYCCWYVITLLKQKAVTGHYRAFTEDNEKQTKSRPRNNGSGFLVVFRMELPGVC